MKKIVLGLLGLFISFVVISQSTRVYILTEDRTDCLINMTTGDVFDCGETIKTPGVFILDDAYNLEINNDVFIHMVPDITSTYYASNTISDGNIVIVDNKSDGGNLYTHFFDFGNKYVNIIFMNPNELNNGNRRIVSIKISQVHLIN